MSPWKTAAGSRSALQAPQACSHKASQGMPEALAKPHPSRPLRQVSLIIVANVPTRDQTRGCAPLLGGQAGSLHLLCMLMNIGWRRV